MVKRRWPSSRATRKKKNYRFFNHSFPYLTGKHVVSGERWTARTRAVLTAEHGSPRRLKLYDLRAEGLLRRGER